MGGLTVLHFILSFQLSQSHDNRHFVYLVGTSHRGAHGSIASQWEFASIDLSGTDQISVFDCQRVEQ